VTHGPRDDGSNTDIDEHLIARLPGGIHLDSLEAKWIAVGVLVGIAMVLTGSTELLALVGPVALGARGARRIPKLAQLEAQPWWWVGGVMLGITLGTIVRLALARLFGITTPDIPWQQALELGLELAQALT